MQLASVPGDVSAIASDGRYVVVCVVDGPTYVFSRASGALLRLLPGPWAGAVLIDGDVIYLAAAATGRVSAFGLHDSALRARPPIGDVKGFRRWSEPGGEGGLVTGGHTSAFGVYDSRQDQLASFGLKQRLGTFDVRGTTLVAAYSAGASRAGPVRAFDCLRGTKLKPMPDGHTGAVLAVKLDDAGLLTAGLDGTVRAYDPALGFMRARALPGQDYVSAFSPDPVDARVVHAIAPAAALRLDRETLEVLERVPVVSPYAALAVDARGRLVGVKGGIESLDPLVTAPPEDAALPDVRAHYEREGSFDKDEQGWCSLMQEVLQDGQRVTVRTWYDANGCLRSDERRHGRIDRVEGGTVILAMDDGGTLRFDLAARRLA